MTSPTGNNPSGCYAGSQRRRRKGLTFIEVMVTVVVLSVGLVAIYRSFFIGIDYLNHLSCRLHALNLIESKIAFAEKDFQSLKDFDIGPMSETVVINNRPVEFHYAIDLKPVGKLLSVFSLDITLSWEERGHVVSVSRSAYFSGVTNLASGT
ncbi:MAG: prepilin-type N-terminal cleavage/methylation domain-containing protein [Candidatus Omnitrophica bacterium]|nr:prepilin-type N-terminal cleavage/methylation domain-containing protein [Candidatus Omnitrophota bacterium]